MSNRVVFQYGENLIVLSEADYARYLKDNAIRQVDWFDYPSFEVIYNSRIAPLKELQ